MENAIHHIYIPAVTGHCPPNDQGRSLLSFPLHLGELGIINPPMISDAQYRTSVAVTNHLVSLLLSRNSCYTRDIMDSQHSAKAKLSSATAAQQSNWISKICTFSLKPLHQHCPRTWCLHLVEYCTFEGPWFHPAQKWFSRCSLSTIWLDACSATKVLCVWCLLYCWACLELSSRKILVCLP